MAEYLTIAQTAKIFGVSRQTIYLWIRDGKLKVVRTPGGRIRIAEGQFFVETATLEKFKKAGLFPIIDISRIESTDIEPMGTKEKLWFPYKGGRYLFKAGRQNTGDDWAEKVTCEICSILQVPHAHYDFAKWGSLKGVITPTFVPSGARLVHGNELISEIEPGYEKTKRFRQSKHTLSRVLAIIDSGKVELPLGWAPLKYVSKAADVFVGYLMLDVLIANQDRHHENWALIEMPDSKIHLAPSYDHASSLGGIELDKNRMDRLSTKDTLRNMKAFVSKARSAFYSSPEANSPMPTLDAFYCAGIEHKEATKAWLNRLEEISPENIRNILGSVPREEITEIASLFAQKIIELNKEALLRLKF